MGGEVSCFFAEKRKKFAITYIRYSFFFVTLQAENEEEVTTCASMGGQLPPTSLT